MVEVYIAIGSCMAGWLVIRVVEMLASAKTSVLTSEEQLVLRDLQKSDVENRALRLKLFETLERLAVLQHEILKELERQRK